MRVCIHERYDGFVPPFKQPYGTSSAGLYFIFSTLLSKGVNTLAGFKGVGSRKSNGRSRSTIGDDVIIGAGSVVLNDVENNQKVVGNPARIIL